MTVAEICAVSYVILWEALERQTLVAMHAALISRMLGGTGEVPNVADVRAAFDASLMEEPARVSSSDTVIMRALGLR